MSDYLPELLPEILCRLPVESLLRFRCVSELWCTLIDSPDFISLYTTATATSTATPLLLLHHFSTKPKKQEHYSVYFDPCSKTENLTLVKELNFPFNRDFRVVGFSNGLFCLSDDIFRCTPTLILWNPAICKSIILPMPGVSSGPQMFCFGFGFDHKSHDFKVVRIAYLGGVEGVYMLPLGVEVYKLSTGLWETINSKGLFNCTLDIDYNSIYLNGAIHWVSHSKNEGGEIINSLLVFNLTNETFSEMGLPPVLAHVSYLDHLSVILCGEHISVIWSKESHDLVQFCDRCVVWVMNQYGKAESWMEKFVVDLNDGIIDAIGFTRNGEFLVVQYPGDLLSYDPESRELKDLDIHGSDDSFFLSKYIESLVLLDGNSEATADPYIASETETETETETESEEEPEM